MRKQVVKKESGSIVWKRMRAKICDSQDIFAEGEGKYSFSSVEKSLASHVLWVNKYPQKEDSFILCVTPIERAERIEVGVSEVASVTPTWNYLYPSEMGSYPKELYPKLIELLGVNELHYVLVGKVG